MGTPLLLNNMDRKLTSRRSHYIVLPGNLVSNPTTQSDNTRIGEHKKIKKEEYKPGVAAESEELYSYIPILGDVMDGYKILEDLTKEKYLNAGIGTGLFLLPNIIEKPIKLVGKSVKNKALQLSKHINSDKLTPSKDVIEVPMKEQNEAFLKGFKDMFKLFGINENGQAILNPNIKRHYEKIGITPSEKTNFNFDRDIDISSYNPTTKEVTAIKSTTATIPNIQSKRNLVRDFGNRRKDRAGVAQIDGIHIGMLRQDKQPLQQIYETGLHEAGHIVKNMYNIILNDSKGVISKNLTHNIKSAVEKTLPSTGWASKLEELRADIWAKRVSLGIGDGEITNDVVEKLLKDSRIKRHFKDDFDKDSAKELIKYIALTGVILNLGNNDFSNREGIR